MDLWAHVYGVDLPDYQIPPGWEIVCTWIFAADSLL